MKLALYRGTHTGIWGIYNFLVRWWTQSPYSHCEIVFDDGMSASSSFMDGGVRFKKINYTSDKWDFEELSGADIDYCRKWFENHLGDKYDVVGNLRFVIGAVPASPSRWLCSESCAAALKIPEPDRYYPGVLASTVRYKYQK